MIWLVVLLCVLGAAVGIIVGLRLSGKRKHQPIARGPLPLNVDTHDEDDDIEAVLVEATYNGPVGLDGERPFIWHIGDPPPLGMPLNNVSIAELPPGASVVHTVQLDDQNRFIIKMWQYIPGPGA